MLHHHTLLGASLLALTMAVPTFAQDTTPAPDASTAVAPEAPTAPDAAPAPGQSPAPEMTADNTKAAADCEGQFIALDTDASGTLTESEAPQVYARSRLDDVTIPETGYSQEEFLAACADDTYARTEPEAGAPFEGANSFTEGQAQDRALAWGVMNVSALTKDDMGVWRGTGTVDGANMAVAVDYKGNVVTTAE